MLDKIEVTWKNVLNYEHLPTGWELSSFADAARNLGYPYINWNGVIYDLNTQKQVVVATEIDNPNSNSKIEIRIPSEAASFTHNDVMEWVEEQEIITINDVTLKYTNGDCVVCIIPFDPQQATPENKAKLWISFVRWFD